MLARIHIQRPSQQRSPLTFPWQIQRPSPRCSPPRRPTAIRLEATVVARILIQRASPRRSLLTPIRTPALPLTAGLAREQALDRHLPLFRPPSARRPHLTRHLCLWDQRRLLLQRRTRTRRQPHLPRLPRAHRHQARRLPLTLHPPAEQIKAPPKSPLLPRPRGLRSSLHANRRASQRASQPCGPRLFLAPPRRGRRCAPFARAANLHGSPRGSPLVNQLCNPLDPLGSRRGSRLDNRAGNRLDGLLVSLQGNRQGSPAGNRLEGQRAPRVRPRGNQRASQAGNPRQDRPGPQGSRRDSPLGNRQGNRQGSLARNPRAGPQNAAHRHSNLVPCRPMARSSQRQTRL